jgi:hypothetical protein
MEWPKYDYQQLSLDQTGAAFQCSGCNNFHEGEICFTFVPGTAGAGCFCAQCVEYALALLWRFKITAQHVS